MEYAEDARNWYTYTNGIICPRDACNIRGRDIEGQAPMHPHCTPNQDIAKYDDCRRPRAPPGALPYLSFFSRTKDIHAMTKSIWVLTCTVADQPPLKAHSVEAVAYTRKGIDDYLRREWADEGEHEYRTSESGGIVERFNDGDGWSPWEIVDYWDSTVALSVYEVVPEEEYDAT